MFSSAHAQLNYSPTTAMDTRRLFLNEFPDPFTDSGDDWPDVSLDCSFDELDPEGEIESSIVDVARQRSGADNEDGEQDAFDILCVPLVSAVWISPL